MSRSSHQPGDCGTEVSITGYPRLADAARHERIRGFHPSRDGFAPRAPCEDGSDAGVDFLRRVRGFFRDLDSYRRRDTPGIENVPGEGVTAVVGEVVTVDHGRQELVEG